MRVVDYPNAELELRAVDAPGPGGASHEYQVLLGGGLTLTLPFKRIDEDGRITPGLTNEVLLAAVSDRLSSFQGGQFACVENEKALAAIEAALKILNGRTARRREQGVEGKLQAHVSPRVRQEADYVFVGEQGLGLDALASWDGWSNLAELALKLKPSITVEEREFLLQLPGNENGRREFEQAMAQLSR